MPYALSCAAISCVAYLVAGFARNVVASLVIGLIFLLLCMFILHFAQRNAERVE
jgi:tetrahydromethanopterin S-methyltransferase subunit B